MANKKMTKKPRKEKVPVKSEVKKASANVTVEKAALEAAKEVKPEVSKVVATKEAEPETTKTAKEVTKKTNSKGGKAVETGETYTTPRKSVFIGQNVIHL